MEMNNGNNRSLTSVPSLRHGDVLDDEDGGGLEPSGVGERLATLWPALV